MYNFFNLMYILKKRPKLLNNGKYKKLRYDCSAYIPLTIYFINLSESNSGTLLTYAIISAKSPCSQY